MKKRNTLTKLTALLVVLVMMLGSFPVVYSEGEAEVTNTTSAPETDVTDEAAQRAAEEAAAASSPLTFVISYIIISPASDAELRKTGRA